MGFQEAVISVFSQYATFSGRARRSEYWYFVLFNVIVAVVIGVITAILPVVGAVLNTLWALAIFIPTLALVWRRLHDIGKSGGWFFIGLIPLVGEIILLVFFCTDSQPGENQYGPSPKG